MLLSRLCVPLTQSYISFHLAFTAVEGYVYVIGGAVAVHDVRHILLVLNIFAVNGNNKISTQHDLHVAQVGALGAAAQSGTVSGAAGDNLQNQHAMLGSQAHLVSKFGADGQRGHAQRRPAHCADSDQVVEHGLGGIDGNREAQAGTLSGFTENKCIHTHTSPRELSSGPPELPGLMAASVWMASSMKLPLGPRTGRMELIMPRVMVPARPKGLPIA